jgi:UDP-N-acetylmuramoyl-tripeptide--D-alanyl-D-alanine ligase
MFTLVVILLLCKSFLQNLFVLYVLQFNEYRFDRFTSYIRRNYKGLLFSAPFLSILAPISLKKLPRPTAKSILLVGLTGLVHFWIFLYFSKILWLIVIFTLATPLVQLGVLCLIIPIEWCLRHFIYTQARSKINQYKKQGLVVVGITGSYGKSTTKYFANHILSSFFNILTTAGSINTPLGLSRIILSKLQPSHQVLIVEMGAYRKGEIAELSAITRPDIAIITGISDQHIELFGGQQNIIEAKSELLNALPAQGLAIINASSQHEPILPDNRLHIEKYGTVESKAKFSNVLAQARVPEFLKTNVEAALILGQHLKMPDDTILKNVITLPLPPKTMDTKTGYNDAIIIDDSFSSNAQGVLAAIQELSSSQKKHLVVVMPCLIELAEKAYDTHVQIGRALSEKNITAIITTPENFGAVQSGFNDKNKCILLTDPQKVIAWLKKNVTKNSAVLIEGRVNATVVEFLAAL